MEEGKVNFSVLCPCGSFEWCVQPPNAEILNALTGEVRSSGGSDGGDIRIWCRSCKRVPKGQKEAALRRLYLKEVANE